MYEAPDIFAIYWIVDDTRIPHFADTDLEIELFFLLAVRSLVREIVKRD